MENLKNLTLEAISERLEIVDKELCHYSLNGYYRIPGAAERFYIVKHDDGTVERRPTYRDIDKFEDGFNYICRDTLTGDLYEMSTDRNIFRQIFKKDAE